jgi:hypothetical protein
MGNQQKRKGPLRGIELLSGDPQSPILTTILQGPHMENLSRSSINLNSTRPMPDFQNA